MNHFATLLARNSVNPAVMALVSILAAEVGETAADNRGASSRRGGFRGAQGESEGGAAIGMAISGVRGAEIELAVGGDDSLDGVKVFANGGGDGDGHDPALKRGAEVREEFVLQPGGEGAEFDAAGRARQEPRATRRNVFAELSDQQVAQADAGAGVIEANAPRAIDAWDELLELVRGGDVLEDEDFASDEDVGGAGRRD